MLESLCLKVPVGGSLPTVQWSILEINFVTLNKVQYRTKIGTPNLLSTAF